MNLQAITVIFIIIFLPIVLVSNFYIQREMETITIQNSYDTKLIDATTDAVSAFELNTANEDLSLIPDSLRSICEASTNVFTTTLATNLGISSASKNKVLPYIPAIVFTLYDGYYIYSPTQQPKVLVDKDGVYVKVGDPGVISDGIGNYLYDPNVDVTKFNSSISGIEPNEFGKMLYCTTENYDPYTATSIKCTTDPNSAYFVTNYILKSFIPYSMQYKSNTDNYDVTINYTLDNYISIKGTIKMGDEQVYYTKSGYLINPDDIEYIDISGYTMDDFKTTNTTSKVSLETVDKVVEDVASAIRKGEDKKCEIGFKNKIVIKATEDSAYTKNFQNTATVSDSESAVKYYLKAYMFSSWVINNLGDLSGNDVVNSATSLQNDFDIKQSGFNLKTDAKVFWDYGNDKIFKTGTDWNINDADSNFVEHKRTVIKNSIQYNLNLAMAVYNAGQGTEYYQMPILSEPEWDKLLSNVSILAFMQGFPCGLKTYNNYALITSTKNEIMTNIDDIYYIPINETVTDHQGVYSDKEIKEKTKAGEAVDLDTLHRIDCMDISWLSEVKTATYFQSFSAKEIKYDKVYDYQNGSSYGYDHVANECYYCVINPNYNSFVKDALKSFEKKNDGTCDADFSSVDPALGLDTSVIKILKKAQLIADAKIKNNTFKSIAATTNYGIDTYNCISDSTPEGNIIFENYYPYLYTTKTDQVIDAKNNINNGDTFNGVLKKYKADNCYEIDITIKLNDPGADEFSSPYIYFRLGNEDAITQKITHTKINENEYLIKFTEPSKWLAGGSDYKFQLINPDVNYEAEYGPWDPINRIYPIIGYRCKIKHGNIKLESITFKYK